MAKAHVYLLAGANVESTDTFASWVDTTNQLVYDMGTVVLTTTSYPQPNTGVGGYTSGNAHVEGLFSANTLIASTALRGGTVNASATMYVTSNTIFSDSNVVQVGANTNNFTVNANNSLFTGNVAINAASSLVTITAANTTINAGNFYVKTPSEFTGSTTDIKGTTLTVTSNSAITSTTLNANVDVITLGFNSTDTLTVNSTTDFNAAVNVDGIFTSTANALFTGAQAQFDNNVILGSSTADSVSINGYLVTDLLPSATTIDLGSDAKPYGNVHTTYVYADSDIESLGELQLKGTSTKTIRVTGSNGSYQNLNLTFSNNSVASTIVVANTSGLFGGIDSLYSIGSSTVKWKDVNAVDFIASNSATLGGDLAVNGGDVTTTAATFNMVNTNATTLNLAGAATTINMGATTGTATINNAALALGASSITTTKTTVALLNTTATTVNAFGAATTLNFGAATGTTNIKNNLDVDGDLNIDGGDITASGTTFNIVNSGITTLNIGGAATTVNLGAATGTTTIASANVAFSGNTATTASATYNLFPTNATTVKAFGAATTLNLGAATGTTNVNNSLVVAGSISSVGNILTSGDMTVSGGDLIMSASANVVNTSTTVNAFGSASTLNIGTTGGTATIKNSTVDLSGSAVTTTSTTFNLLNTTATTVNAFGAASTINIGSATATNLKIGNTTGDSTLTIHGNGATGNTTITSNVTTGTFKIAPSITSGDIEIGSANTGAVKVLFTGSSITTPNDNALIVSGGAYVGQSVKVGGDTSIDGNTTINGGLTVVGKVLFSNTDLEMSVNTSIVNTMTVMETLVLNSGTGAVVASDIIPSNATFDLGSTVTTWDGVYANNVSATSSVAIANGTKDGIILAGSTLGTNTRRISIVPPALALSANRTVTLPDGDVLLRTGNTAVHSDKLSVFAATTSTELRSVISDETGTGSLVFATSPSLTTPTIGGAGATFSGSTSGTTVLKASATAGTTTVTMPATTGTMALTSDIGNGALTINVSDGLAGTNASFTANQSASSSISITNADKGSSQNIFKNIAVGANTIVAGTNSDTFTVTGTGIVNVTANATTKVITVTATEVDTLASVTGRGSSTSTTLDLTNTTASTSTTTGAVKLSGGMGIGGSIHVGGASRVYSGFTVDGALSGNTASFSSDVIISGNLTINGTTTVINSTDLSVDDKNIIIGDVATPSNTTADGGGITLKGATDKTIIWDTTNSNWTSSENWNIPTGKVFKINNVSVLSSTALGSSVVGSSLTSVGTLTTGTWSATTIAVNKGGTGQTSYVNGEILIGNTTGNTLTKATLTQGQNITVTNGAGAITIAAANTNLTWTNGNTAGPVINSSTGSGAAIPLASATTSGAVSTAAQTFAGTKTFSSTISGSIDGNAGSATILQTARAINGVDFNGSAAITVTANTNFALTRGTYLIGDSATFDGSAASTWSVDATNLNTASKVVARDASGNFSANNITATLIGNASTATSATNATTVTNGVYTTGDQTIGGIKTFSSTIVGSINGNAATVTNGVYTTGNQTIAGVKTFSSTISGSITGNSGTVTNGVYTTSDQTIGGIKTFSSTIVGSINGNAETVTNGVYTTSDQSIAGIKTFSNNIVTSAVSSSGYLDQDTVDAAIFGTVTHSASSYAPLIKLRATGTSNVTTGSFGILHNADNTQEVTIHSIQAADANSRIWRFASTGDFTSPGNVTAYSDERLKTNIRTIDNALDKVSQLRGVYFDKDGKASTGVIAQEIEKVLPEVVLNGEYKSVAYGNVIGVLIEAIKELKSEIEELKRDK